MDRLQADTGGHRGSRRGSLPAYRPRLALGALLVGGLVLAPAAATSGDAPQQVQTQQVQTQQVQQAKPPKYSKPLRQAVRDLPVKKERRTGYARSKFPHWVDADSDRCDTREEVLLAEAKEKVTPGEGCAVRSGRWVSYYDRVTVTVASKLDIDHMVPLAEAWDSGASRWTPATRKAFANDLGDPRSLVAVTASSNRSKADGDPAEWLPRFDRCRYLREWTAVKLRWRLSVDSSERAVLVRLAGACPNPTLTVTRATIQESAGTTGKVALGTIAYDPPGADTSDKLNQEWVTVVNTGESTATVTGWRLTDASGSSFTFPATAIGKGRSVTVHSGRGSDKPGHRYAGWGWVWNNTGDTASLLDQAGRRVDTCTYTAGNGTHRC